MKREKQLLSENIRRLLRNKGATQVDLSKATKLHYVTINEIINQPDRNVALKNIVLIANALNVPIAELFSDEDDNAPKFDTVSQKLWWVLERLCVRALPGVKLTEDRLRVKFELLYNFFELDPSVMEEYWNDRRNYGKSLRG